MARRLLVNNFCVIPVTEDFNSPNLLVPVKRSRIIKTFHLSPINFSFVSTGQSSRLNIEKEIVWTKYMIYIKIMKNL